MSTLLDAPVAVERPGPSVMVEVPRAVELPSGRIVPAGAYLADVQEDGTARVRVRRFQLPRWMDPKHEPSRTGSAIILRPHEFTL